MLNFNNLKQKDAAIALQKAMTEGKEEDIQQAWVGFQQSIVDTVKADFAEYSMTQDKTILSQRGYRQLTNAEEKYYEKFIEASKSPNPKQAFIELSSLPEGIMPETIIEDVFKELVEEHPLLDKINFNYAKYMTKWVLNDHTLDTAVWGELNSEITKQITSAFKIVDITQNKLSAFAAIPLDMLDLGPTFLDAYIRAVLKDAILCGLEKAIVDGTGKNQPIGLTRDVSEDVSVSAGVYPPKTPIAVTSFTPAEYGKLLAKMAKNEKGRMRKFGKVLLICNQEDYLTKIMPATTVQNTSGTYINNLFPFPTDVTISNELETGKAVICLPEEYFMCIGGAKEGVITYSDEYKFLEDMRYYKIKTYGAGKAYDDTVSILLDITGLNPAYITVNTDSAATQSTSSRKAK
ncbi:MAG: phage major capsid protein [Romboutsia timonensis]|jgi:HK97 family phage major capsid protein|nr:phage major capsid protein [uncultured Romboutsia sp.]